MSQKKKLQPVEKSMHVACDPMKTSLQIDALWQRITEAHKHTLSTNNSKENHHLQKTHIQTYGIHK